MPGLLAPHRSIFTRIVLQPGDSGSVPDAELKILLECLEKWSIKTSKTAFSHFSVCGSGSATKNLSIFNPKNCY
jgi:hypothetical protein